MAHASSRGCGRRRTSHLGAGALVVLCGVSCAVVSNIEERDCARRCASETATLVCPEGEPATASECSGDPSNECLRGVCREGACTLAPADGAACEQGAKTCNGAGICTSSGGIRLSALHKHNCAILDDGSIWCWGRNEDGELGDGTSTFRNAPVRVRHVDGLQPAKAIGTGYAHSCAVGASDALFCWGNNEAGQAGPEPGEDVLEPTPVPGFDGMAFVSVTAGYGHTCARSASGGAHCWGYNHFGECGKPLELPNGEKQRIVRPDSRPILTDVTVLESIKQQNCALLASQSQVFCWGRNIYGQLALPPDGVAHHQPLAIPGIAQPTGIALSFESSYAIDSAQGWLYAWGSNKRGQLGIGDHAEVVHEPTRVKLEIEGRLVDLEGVLAVFRSDGSDMCARLDSEEMPWVCWGADHAGELAFGNGFVPGAEVFSARPAKALESQARELARGEDHGCYLHDDDVWCWGEAPWVGDGSVTELSADEDAIPPRLVPTRVKWSYQPP